MSDAADIWRKRKLDAEALIEQAQELEEAAESHDLPLDEIAIDYVHANNLRLRALCLLDPTTRAVETERAEEDA